MRSRVSRFTVALSVLLLTGAGVWAPAAHAEADAQAQKVIKRLWQGLGGKKAWQETHYIRFTFAGRRTHFWDRYTGRHRLTGKTKDGKTYLVLDNIQTQKGRVWLDGKEITGEQAAKFLKLSYAAWVNDTYWLLMPYKLENPGVHVTYDGKKKVGPSKDDVLHLSFGKVGLTPGDQYWVYVSPATGLVDRFTYHLQGHQKGTWNWLDWQRYGGIMLSPKRTRVDGKGELDLANIKVFDQLPDSVFNSPEPVPAADAPQAP